VVSQDQTISTATIQVTVDNQPPTIQVTHPIEGQDFEYPQERTVTFQAQATDNLGITRVEFLVDGASISSLTEPPYAAPWTGPVGEHSIKAIATDFAGNQDEVSVNFSIER
jgi:chitodextrinase